MKHYNDTGNKTMQTPVPADNTVGEIARRLGQPVHRIVYVIKSRQMRPVRCAGNARVFSEDDVAKIADALANIAAKKVIVQ